MMDIQRTIAHLKSCGRIQSNAYSEDIINDYDELLIDGDTILLSKKDHGVSRLYYFTNKFERFGTLLSQLQNEEYVLEFMTRIVDEHQEMLADAGFIPIAHLMRMSTRDINTAFENPEVMQFYDESIGKKPSSNECTAVNQILWHIFDTRISHLLSDEEILEVIRKDQITIHKDKHEKIASILQVTEEPKKFYINQIYNGGEKRIIHAMLLNRLKHYTESGGKYAYAWVDQDNIASIKFHQKYGLKHDGMWNQVYCLRKM